MTGRADLLIEVGTEELPPKSLPRLSQAFADGIAAGLDALDLDHGAVFPYATPRRLAVRVEELATEQPAREVVRRGPALAAAFDEDGRPTRAAEGFARSCGVAVADLDRLETERGTWLAWRQRQPGRPTAALLPEVLLRALDGLPVARRMRWGSHPWAFVRPVHWAVVRLGDTVVDCEVLGVRAGGASRGHRFHHPGAVTFDSPRDYAARLEEVGRVVAAFDARRARIERAARAAAAELGGEALVGDALLDEVTALVEWPVVMTGSFDAEFLELPREVLIATLEGHQRYFAVAGADGALLPHFIFVANIDSRDPGRVRAGNERVVRPRLADARFFWHQDLRTPLVERLEALGPMVFHQRLGSLLDKTRRVEALARRLAPAFGADPDTAARAARLARCDLTTHMVGEFPELQGVMGRYYAEAAGEPREVALAIDEMYRPRFATDAIADTPAGRALAVADRLDTLAGIFGVGEAPTGEKDPLGLRRAALGVLRTLIEGGVALDLREALAAAVAGYPAGTLAEDTPQTVFEFMLERLRRYYLDRGVPADVFDAVHAVRPGDPLDFDARIRAVQAFTALPEAETLAAARKRIANLLRKAGDEAAGAPDAALLAEPAEQALAQAIEETQAALAPLTAQGAYTEALRRLAALRPAVDRFFDEVLVMSDDPATRRNRLALLARLGELLSTIADIGRLHTARR